MRVYWRLAVLNILELCVMVPNYTQMSAYGDEQSISARIKGKVIQKSMLL